MLLATSKDPAAGEMLYDSAPIPLSTADTRMDPSSDPAQETAVVEIENSGRTTSGTTTSIVPKQLGVGVLVSYTVIA